MKCQWTKEICSQNTEAHDDIGEFEDLHNGDALERGSMPNPDNGDKVQEYEEVWGAIDVPSSDVLSWIIRAKDGNGVTYIGRIGDYYQALRKANDGSFSALREQKEAGKWEKKHAVGEALPSIAAMGERAFDTKTWTQGSDVDVARRTYSVYSLEKA